MDLQNFFKHEVKATMGCTEPGAIAYAAAFAASYLEGALESILVRVSLAMYKNARSVGIPGTDGLQGIMLAAALGAVAGNPDIGLMALKDVGPAAIAKAQEMLNENRVREEVDAEHQAVWAEVVLKSSSHTVGCVVRHYHDHIDSVEVDGRVVMENRLDALSEPNPAEQLARMNFQRLWELAGAIEPGVRSQLLEGAAMNLGILQYGGPTAENEAKNLLSRYESSPSLLLRIKRAAGHAAALRMSGRPVQVMSSAGSGNHGLVAIIPVAMVAKELKADEKTLAEALALSHLVCGHIKYHTGRLTPSCGCAVAAGAGAAAGIARLYGGNAKQAEQAVVTLVAALLGMVCDGAKESCALKVSSAAGEAWMAAVLSLEGKGINTIQGVITPDIQSLGKMLQVFNKELLRNADAVMVEIMTRQKTC